MGPQVIFGVNYGALWGFINGSFLNDLGVIFDAFYSICVIFGGSLFVRSFWGHSDHFGKLQDHFRIFFGSFWGYFGVILGSPGVHHFWIHFKSLMSSFREAREAFLSGLVFI